MLKSCWLHLRACHNLVFQKVIGRALELLGGILIQEAALHLNKELMEHGTQRQTIKRLRMNIGSKENFLLPRADEMILL